MGFLEDIGIIIGGSLLIGLVAGIGALGVAWVLLN